jgi:hypothetical protein
MKKRAKKPWPTKAVMNQIYEQHLWGGHQFDFYSGEGSHSSEIITPYIEAVSRFLKTHGSSLTVCDLGCGDFNIGKELLNHTSKYIAIDIVESLIERNKALFKKDNLEFHCLDIAKDQIPQGDCVILRQVLQHLSNEEIQSILPKLMTFKHVIVTEQVPCGDFTANENIISGQGIRLKKGSGVNLLEPPFDIKVKQTELLNVYHLEQSNSQIITTLYTCF